jgi:hypothetical protein
MPKSSKDYEKQLVWRRLAYAFLAMIVPIVASFPFYQHAVARFVPSSGQDLSYWIWDAILVLTIGLAVFFFTEPFLRCQQITLPRHGDPLIAKLLRDLVERWGTVDDLAQAKLLLFLVENDGDEVTVEATFTQYLKILCAATSFAQREWFATHTLPLNTWPAIALHASQYFDALAGTRLIKKRVLVRPPSEIDAVGEGDDIVVDTLKSGAKLICISSTKVAAKGLKVQEFEDYALFDDDLAIVGGNFLAGGALTTAPHEFNPDSLQLKVRILRKGKVVPYTFWKERLEEIDPDKDFSRFKAVK